MMDPEQETVYEKSDRSVLLDDICDRLDEVGNWTKTRLVQVLADGVDDCGTVSVLKTLSRGELLGILIHEQFNEPN